MVRLFHLYVGGLLCWGCLARRDVADYLGKPAVFPAWTIPAESAHPETTPAVFPTFTDDAGLFVTDNDLGETTGAWEGSWEGEESTSDWKEEVTGKWMEKSTTRSPVATSTTIYEEVSPSSTDKTPTTRGSDSETTTAADVTGTITTTTTTTSTTPWARPTPVPIGGNGGVGNGGHATTNSNNNHNHNHAATPVDPTKLPAKLTATPTTTYQHTAAATADKSTTPTALHHSSSTVDSEGERTKNPTASTTHPFPIATLIPIRPVKKLDNITFIQSLGRRVQVDRKIERMYTSETTGKAGYVNNRMRTPDTCSYSVMPDVGTFTRWRIFLSSSQFLESYACGMCFENTVDRFDMLDLRANRLGFGLVYFVTGECITCEKGDVLLEDMYDGRERDVSLRAIPCPTPTGMNIEFMFVGSNSSFIKLQARNFRYPVTRMEVLPTGAEEYLKMIHTVDGFFVYQGPEITLPMTIKLYAFNGMSVTEEFHDIENNMVLESSVQFPLDPRDVITTTTTTREPQGPLRPFPGGIQIDETIPPEIKTTKIPRRTMDPRWRRGGPIMFEDPTPPVTRETLNDESSTVNPESTINGFEGIDINDPLGDDGFLNGEIPLLWHNMGKVDVDDNLSIDNDDTNVNERNKEEDVDQKLGNTVNDDVKSDDDNGDDEEEKDKESQQSTAEDTTVSVSEFASTEGKAGLSQDASDGQRLQYSLMMKLFHALTGWAIGSFAEQ